MQGAGITLDLQAPSAPRSPHAPGKGSQQTSTYKLTDPTCFSNQSCLIHPGIGSGGLKTTGPEDPGDPRTGPGGWPPSGRPAGSSRLARTLVVLFGPEGATRSHRSGAGKQVDSKRTGGQQGLDLASWPGIVKSDYFKNQYPPPLQRSQIPRTPCLRTRSDVHTHTCVHTHVHTRA